MSKVVERVVAHQLHEYLTTNDMLRSNQSAHHCTETAMLRVMSEALLAAADTGLQRAT